MQSRTVHGITWSDDLGWMDAMKGSRWQHVIQEAQARWTQTTEKLQSDAKIFATEIRAANAVSTIPLFQSHDVQIAKGGTTFLQWCWRATVPSVSSNSEYVYAASDIDTCIKFPGMVWAMEDVQEAGGGEVYQLACYVRESKKPVWTVRAKDSFAPCLAVLNGRVYVLEGTNRLMYKILVSFDALTGKERKVHYEESNAMYNLHLERCFDKGAYLVRSTGPKQDLFWINERGDVHVLEGISLESRRFVVSDIPHGYFTWTAREGWQASPALRKSIPLPKLPPHHSVESISCRLGLLITKHKGERFIWKLKGKAKGVCWSGIANVTLDTWDGCWVRIQQPGCEALWWNTERDEEPRASLSLSTTMEVLDFDRGALRAVIIRQRDTEPKGLMVVGYGAYGIPTQFNTARWQPLLHRGWAVCIGLYRGGGDDSPAWEDAGRLSGREVVLMDAEEVIRAAQKATGCSAHNTWLYGRSAGGLWVGGIVASRGCSICSGAYMEVPYLDVLQTTTNETLPLTLLETDEFGRPAQRISDLEGMLRWSPMELLRADPSQAKEVLQIIRTGLNDKEVYAYESVKWATRCGENCYLAVENNQGHFVGGTTALEQEGLDLVLLLQLCAKENRM